MYSAKSPFKALKTKVPLLNPSRAVRVPFKSLFDRSVLSNRTPIIFSTAVLSFGTGQVPGKPTYNSVLRYWFDGGLLVDPLPSLIHCET